MGNHMKILPLERKQKLETNMLDQQKKYDSNDKYTSTQEGSEEKGLPSIQESQNFNSDDNSMDKGPGTQKAFEDSEELHDIIRRQEEREIIKSELNSKRQATYPVSGPSNYTTSHEAQQE